MAAITETAFSSARSTARTGVVADLLKPIARLVDDIERMICSAKTRTALASLSDRQLEDIGIFRAQIEEISRDMSRR